MSTFTDRIRDGLDRVDNYAGTTVRYVDGLRYVNSLPVVPGATKLEVVDHEGLTTHRRLRDYKVNAADLLFARHPLEPASGAHIIETIGGKEVTFEVFAPGGSERPWRWADSARTRYRVHTREIKPC